MRQLLWFISLSTWRENHLGRKSSLPEWRTGIELLSIVKTLLWWLMWLVSNILCILRPILLVMMLKCRTNCSAFSMIVYNERMLSWRKHIKCYATTTPTLQISSNFSGRRFRKNFPTLSAYTALRFLVCFHSWIKINWYLTRRLYVPQQLWINFHAQCFFLVIVVDSVQDMERPS